MVIGYAAAAPAAAAGGGLSFGQTAALMGLGGGIGFAGSMMAGSQSYKATKKLIAWQDLLSRTQYQRATDDLRKAGLNPALSVTGLSPAAVPGGATPTIPDHGKNMLQGMANATALKGMISQTKLVENQAGIAGIERRLSQEAIDLLGSNEQLRRIVLGGKIATMAGVPGNYGALISAINEAVKKTKIMEKPTGKGNLSNKDVDEIMKKYGTQYGIP